MMHEYGRDVRERMFKRKGISEEKPKDLKSINLQYNMLGCLDNGTNEALTKASDIPSITFFHDFLQNYLQKSFQFISYFFIKLQKQK